MEGSIWANGGVDLQIDGVDFEIEGVDLHKSRDRFQINGVELQIEWVDLQIDPSICANRWGWLQIEGSICKSTPSISYKDNFQTKSKKTMILFENCLCMILRGLFYKSTPRFVINPIDWRKSTPSVWNRGSIYANRPPRFANRPPRFWNRPHWFEIDPSICANRPPRFAQIDPIDLQIDPSICSNRPLDLSYTTTFAEVYSMLKSALTHYMTTIVYNLTFYCTLL